jgi:hypothetical protein
MIAIWRRALLLLLLGSPLLLMTSAQHNNRPPRFMIDGQTEIVLRLKEGSATPAGKIFNYKEL